MPFKLRPYQKDCLDAIIKAIPLQKHILVQAGTGAGKTLVFCKLIETLLNQWPHIRIGILAHRRELITQAQDKLLNVWPQAPVGVACASTGMAIDIDRPVVIGSVQTLMRRVEKTAPFDIVIVDECFHSSTLVMTDGGEVPISGINIGDKVFTGEAYKTVKNVFKNKMRKDRLCLVRFSSGIEICCSSDHLFYTKSGWIKAANLKDKDCVKYAIQKQVSNLHGNVCDKGQKTKILLEKMLDRKRTIQKINDCLKQKRKNARIQASPQSSIKKRCPGKNTQYKKSKRDITCSTKETIWKRIFIIARDIINNSFKRDMPKRLDKRASIKNSARYDSKRKKARILQQNGVSNLLQSRYWSSWLANSYRDRWTITSRKKKKNGRKERHFSKFDRVESVSLFKRESDKRKFENYISNSARNSEYITLYDLEIEEIHQYCANGILVHNCHRVPPINKKSQYQQWLAAMKQYNPKVRILGFTATPFRLGHGYIYGKVKRPDHDNLFDSLNYRIGISELQEQGFLCGYRAKEARNISRDLKKVKVAGDYNTADLAEVMSRSEHVGSAVRAMEKYAADRKRIVVFCVTIEHAEKVMHAFRKAGYTAACVHSKMGLEQRDMTLRLFEKGLVRIICNVGVLTEGWDSPAVDCVIMCRPTKSAALYVQMCGRGLRPHPGKADVLILDLSNNCATHGDPDTPKVAVPGRGNGAADPILKVCPKCFELVAVAAKVCRACGYVWPVETVEHHGEVEMKNVAWSQAPAPLAVDIVDVQIEDYTSRAGNNMLRMKMTCQTGASIQTMWVNEFFDFEGNGSKWGQKRAQRLWQHLVGTDPPKTVDEARNRYGELQMSLPDRIEIIEKNKWWNVHHWGVKPWNLTGEENGRDPIHDG